MATPRKRHASAPTEFSTPSPKRQRTVLTLEKKIELINVSEKNPLFTHKDLSEKFGVGRSSVSEILTRKEFFRDKFTQNSGLQVQRFIHGKREDINAAVHKWFCQARSKIFPLSGPIIQERALDFAKELGDLDFKASNGWLDNWKRKYEIKFYKVCGESNDVSKTEVEKFKSKLPELLSSTAQSDIFNCDETGLFFRALPDRSLSSKSDACKGGKLAKERLTVMLACSATGEKLKPLVIGKSSKPRCFKNVKIESLPCKWEANKKAWMTGEIFKNWVNDINKTMKKKKRHITLFLDNATSHSDSLRLSNVTLRFFPPNTTSLLQPLDLGIIRAFKARYRKHLMRSLIAKMDSCTTVTILTRSLSVLDAIFWIAKSWDETSATTIAKCFAAAGFCVTPQETDDEDLDDDDNIPIADLVKRSMLKIDGYDDVSKHFFCYVCVAHSLSVCLFVYVSLFVQMRVSSSAVCILY